MSSTSYVAAMILAGVLLVPGCRGSRLPSKVTLNGTVLDRATTWEGDGVSSVILISSKERMATATLRARVLTSRQHGTANLLSGWVLKQYHQSPRVPLHEASTASEACRIGTIPGPSPQDSPRSFVAVHVCRGGQGLAVCAEADERLSDNDVIDCLYEPVCWDNLCSQKLALRRAALEGLVKDSLEGH